MKKIILVVMILVLVSGLVGCETIQRKFTRKTKRRPIRPRFYTAGAQETRPNIELYMMHYTYWKTWHEDLVANAGVNAKRDKMASGNALSHLNDMKKYLMEEKAEELDGYIKQTRDITDRITKDGGSLQTQIGRLKQRLDNIRARVVRKFYYKKVKDYIKPDQPSR